MKTTDKKDNLSIENTEELRILLSEKDENISQLEKQVSDLEWYKEQVLAFTKARMGKSSEKITDGQLNLFNEIEEFVDVSVQEPEIAHKKNKTKKVKEADFSKLPSTTIHHELKDKSCGGCYESMKELQPTVLHIL